MNKYKSSSHPDGNMTLSATGWRLRALAAVILSLGVMVDASALALGRIQVFSALGEPLRAEVDVPQITAEEASSLKIGVADPEAFTRAGMDYSAVLGGVKVTLQQRPGGQSYLRLSSDRPVSEPFLDLILEAHWASGRVVRDYTILLDPPGLKTAAPAPVTAPQLPPVESEPVASGGQTEAGPAESSAPVVEKHPAEPAAKGEGKPVPPTPATKRQPTEAPTKAAPSGQTVRVVSGDTAGRIAAAHKPVEVSLDQMLVAMLRSNPDAFIGGNVNRLKAGVVLDIPSAEQAAAVPAAQARRTVIAQSANFNEFRRRLADRSGHTVVGGASRRSTGAIQTDVAERKPSATNTDRLTLSKGSVAAKASPEAKIAQNKAAQAQSDRMSELSKNTKDLGAVAKQAAALEGTPAAGGTSASAANAGKGVSVPVKTPGVPATAPTPPVSTTINTAVSPAPAPVPPAKPAAPTTPPVTPTPAPAASGAGTPATPAVAPPAATASTGSATAAVAPPAAAGTATTAPATSTAALPPTPPATSPADAPPPASPPPAPKPPAPAPLPPVEPPVVEEPSLLDSVLSSPMLPVGGVLVAAAAGFGWYRSRRRKKNIQIDSSFIESRAPQDSFFGQSGGQRINTRDSAITQSSSTSMAYSPSQLDAGGDVDPVAEADVYLAYGRDLQAEEILKEALRLHPAKLNIHAKLLEVYARRRDAKGFEALATQAYNLSNGQGPEWAHICQMGLQLEPSNGLYHPGGRPQAPSDNPHVETAHGFGRNTVPQSLPPEDAGFGPSSSNEALDVDLDFGSAMAPAVQSPPPSVAAPSAMHMHDSAPSHRRAGTGPAPVAAAPQFPSPPSLPDLDLPDLNLSKAGSSSASPVSHAAASAAPEIDSGMIEFDMGSLSDDSRAPVSQQSDSGFTEDDPLQTKLALAREFHAIGDSDGARALVKEVVAEASGKLKEKAQQFLAELN